MQFRKFMPETHIYFIEAFQPMTLKNLKPKTQVITTTCAIYLLKHFICSCNQHKHG